MKTQKKDTAVSISFRLLMKGEGIVNFDESKTQKKAIWAKQYNETPLARLRHIDDNVSYAKKVIDADGNYKIKISSDCIIHDLFKNHVIAQSPAVVYDDEVLYSFLASSTGLLRGYFMASKSESYKKSGAFTLTDAIQTNNASSKLDAGSRSGEKTKRDENLDKGDNTFFSRETAGTLEYSASGFVDLKKLQFLSVDNIFDRAMINADKYDLYSKYLSLTLPNFNADLGYYKLNTSHVDIPEHGVLLTEDQTIFLVKKFFNLLLELSIKRRSTYATVSSIQYKIITDPIEELTNSSKWIDLKSRADVDNMNFSVREFYTLQDNKESTELRRRIVASKLKNDEKLLVNKKKEQKAKSDAKKKKLSLTKSK